MGLGVLRGCCICEHGLLYIRFALFLYPFSITLLLIRREESELGRTKKFLYMHFLLLASALSLAVVDRERKETDESKITTENTDAKFDHAPLFLTLWDCDSGWRRWSKSRARWQR